MRPLIWIAGPTLAIAALLLFPACDSVEDGVDNTDFAASEDFLHELPITGKTRLRLSGINGNIIVESVDGTSRIRISGERRVASSSFDDAQRHLTELEIVVTETGSEVSVATKQPDDSRGRSYVVDYEVEVPTSFDVLINNVNGNVDVDDVSGRISVELVNGNIDAFSGHAPGDDVDLSTVNGNIDLTVHASTSASFSATVVNGNIRVDDLELSDMTSTHTRVTGTLGTGGDRSIDLSTVNGNINATGRD